MTKGLCLVALNVLNHAHFLTSWKDKNILTTLSSKNVVPSIDRLIRIIVGTLWLLYAREIALSFDITPR